MPVDMEEAGRVIQDGIIGFERKKTNKSIYEDQSKNLDKRRMQKLRDKTNWHNKERDNDTGPSKAEGLVS